MSEWKSVKDELPPAGVVVVTMIDKGNEINNMTLLKRINNLWFFQVARCMFITLQHTGNIGD